MRNAPTAFTSALSVAQAEEASAAEGHAAAAARLQQSEQGLQALLAESASAGMCMRVLPCCASLWCQCDQMRDACLAACDAEAVHAD